MILFDISFSVTVLKYKVLKIYFVKGYCNGEKFSDLNLRKIDWDTKTQVLMLS